MLLAYGCKEGGGAEDHGPPRRDEEPVTTEETTVWVMAAWPRIPVWLTPKTTMPLVAR